MRRIAALGAAAGALAIPASAQAHVTLQPNETAAKGFTVEDVRVPNERDKADTTKVDVKFPPGFAEVSYQVVPGWTTKVIKTKLAKPIQTDDGPVTEQVSEIIWTADKGSGIAPGQFQDFPLSVQVPDKAGQKLTFKALQTYSNGEIVRWIGAPGSDTPAPQVTVTAAQPEGGHAAMNAADTSKPASSDSSTSDDFASKGLGIAGLIVGALGLIVAIVAVVLSRRKKVAA
jgi:periplasmic copper chaperone A